MPPYAHKTSFLSKSSRTETTCSDSTEAVFAPLVRCRGATNAIPSPPDQELTYWLARLWTGQMGSGWSIPRRPRSSCFLCVCFGETRRSASG
jgi:hypothetical protein